MRSFSGGVLWLAGLSLVGFGLAFLVAPLAMMAVAGVALDGAVAATEVRAFYGGLELALGVLVLACALRHERERAGLWLVFAVFAGLGVARLAGMIIGGADTTFFRWAVGMELALAIAAGIALWVGRDRG